MVGKNLFVIVIFALLLIGSFGFVFAVNDLIALQGNVKQTGVNLALGDLQVAIWDSYTGGNVVYNSTTDFENAISDGEYDVMIGNGSNELNLAFGEDYFIEIFINGGSGYEAFTYSGSATRQVFQSSVGMINASVINPAQINFSHISLDNDTNLRTYNMNHTGTNWAGQMLDTILDKIYNLFTSMNTTANIEALDFYKGNHTKLTFDTFNLTWDDQALISSVNTTANIEALNFSRGNQTEITFNLYNDTWDESGTIISNNISMYNYVNTQDSAYNLSVYNYVNTQDTAFNVSAGDYTDLINNSLASFVATTYGALAGGNSWTGNQDFNGGLEGGGATIIGGNMFLQTLYVVNITSLGVDNMNINGTIVPGNSLVWNNTFDIGNETLRWRYGYFGTDVLISGSGSVKKWMYNQTTEASSLFQNSFDSNFSALALEYGNYNESQFAGSFDTNISTIGNAWLNVSELGAYGDSWLNISDFSTYGSDFNQSNFQGAFDSNFSSLALEYGNYNESQFAGSFDLNISTIGDEWLNISELGTYGDSWINISEFQTSFDLNVTGVSTIVNWTTNGSAIWTQAGVGQVGIGTDSPTEALEVVGTTLTDRLRTGYLPGSVTTYGNVIGHGTVSGTYSQAIGHDINVSGDFSVGIGLGNPVGDFPYEVTGDGVFSILGGEVGIGTAAPNYLLEIANNAKSLNVSGMLYANSTNVGIGTTAPQQTLDVAGILAVGDTTDGVAIELQNTEGTILGLDTDRTGYNDLDIRSQGTTQLYLETDGDVGIGTATPTYPLHVLGSVYSSNKVIGYSGFTMEAGDFDIGHRNDGIYGPNSMVFYDSANYGRFAITQGYGTYTGGSHNVTGNIRAGGDLIVDGGDIGIGADTNLMKLTSGVLTIDGQIKNNNWMYSSKGLLDLTGHNGIGVDVDNEIRFATDNQNRMKLDADGNLGIGVTNPSYKLDVNGNVSLNNNLFVRTDGNVGIGITNPVYKLQINEEAPQGLGLYVKTNSTQFVDSWGIKSEAVGTGNNVYAIYGNSIGAGATYGIYGTASGGSTNYGVYGIETRDNAYGILGYDTGSSYGGYFNKGAGDYGFYSVGTSVVEGTFKATDYQAGDGSPGLTNYVWVASGYGGGCAIFFKDGLYTSTNCPTS